MILDTTRDSHDQVEVSVMYAEGEYETFKCDHLLAPLIDKLNKAGLWTEFCCSGHEEDAFGTMYIAFNSGDQTMNDKVRKLVDASASCLTYEDCYRFCPRSDRGKHYIQMTEPTLSELDHATQLCFGVSVDDVFDTSNGITIKDEYKEDVNEYIIVRPDFFEEFKRDTLHLDGEDFARYIEDHRSQNLSNIVYGIERMIKLLEMDYAV